MCTVNAQRRKLFQREVGSDNTAEIKRTEIHRTPAERPRSIDMKVIAVNCDGTHRFSKSTRLSIRLVAGHGIEGDAHAGRFIQHRYQARQTPKAPNNRQVHLIQSELFDEMKHLGFVIGPGDLGENITTRGLDLVGLPLGTHLHIGRTAVVELTGLRTPCGYIDKFQRGLKRAMIVRTPGDIKFRAGVLGVVKSGGDVAAADAISVEMPLQRTPLPAI
jgi:MOSC domain-containing protein YiiM